jgi:hypothetical protein
MSAEPHARQLPETAAIDTRRVLWAVVGALVLLFGAVAALDAIYINAVPVRTMPPPETFPVPRLQVDERAQLRRILAEQRQRLDRYRWIDESHTYAQIPIDRARAIIAREGTEAYAPLIASEPALSPPTAGAERAITPDGKSMPAPATTGVARSDKTGGASPPISDPQGTPLENRQ